jgi:hypothetical protein
MGLARDRSAGGKLHGPEEGAGEFASGRARATRRASPPPLPRRLPNEHVPTSGRDITMVAPCHVRTILLAERRAGLGLLLADRLYQLSGSSGLLRHHHDLTRHGPRLCLLYYDVVIITGV